MRIDRIVLQAAAAAMAAMTSVGVACAAESPAASETARKQLKPAPAAKPAAPARIPAPTHYRNLQEQNAKEAKQLDSVSGTMKQRPKTAPNAVRNER